MKRIVLLLAACSSHQVLRGSPPAAPPAIDGDGAELAVPARGEARAEQLANGWPVWVVHRFDDTVSVLSAVGPIRQRSAATLFDTRASLVRWVPMSHRFIAGDVAYDDNGMVLGYANERAGIAESAPEERDLDRFEILAHTPLVVGQLHAAPGRAGDDSWKPMGQGEHERRELAVAASEPESPESRATTYAIVTGSIVQSTDDVPHLCSCRSCADAPVILGVPEITINQTALHAATGTLLVRHDRDGVAVIAMHAHECSPQPGAN